MGRDEAAIAVAIVSAKPGELNLARTIWGLRTRKRWGGGEGALRGGSIEGRAGGSPLLRPIAW